MNFYVGNSFDELNQNSINAYFTAEFAEFLFESRDTLPVDLSWLFEMDPYNDVVLSHHTVHKVFDSCFKLKQLEIWNSYEFPEDGKCAVCDLLKLAEDALGKGKGLVSEGD